MKNLCDDCARKKCEGRMFFKGERLLLCTKRLKPKKTETKSEGREVSKNCKDCSTDCRYGQERREIMSFERVRKNCEYAAGSGTYCWSDKRDKGVSLCTAKHCPKMRAKKGGKK